MGLAPKDYLVLVSLAIAIVTTLFNIWDRRRHYKLESDKVRKELSRNLLGESSFLEDKYQHYKSVMTEVSNLNASLIATYEQMLLSEEGEPTKMTPSLDTAVFSMRLDKILDLLRSNSAVVPGEVHRAITRDLYFRANEALAALAKAEESLPASQARQLVNDLIGISDQIKTVLENDFAATFHLMKMPAEEPR